MTPRRTRSLAPSIALAALGALAALAGAAAAQPERLRVVVLEARGVGPTALRTAVEAYEAAGGFEVRVAGPEAFRDGSALEGARAVLFTGGRGSVQGQLLGEQGRERVRRFVAGGGGYVGICAGAYLAMQGPAEFHKIAIVAAENATGDRWRRGTRAAALRARGEAAPVVLHYENGPLIAPARVPGLTPFVPLATFETDVHWPRYDTHPGEMPGTAAVVAARYREGRVLLFSPNPTMDPARPELLVQATRWVVARGAVPARLSWRDVYDP